MKAKSLVTLATAGITLFGAGFFWGSNLAFKREENKNLEQIVIPQETIEQIPQFEEIYNYDLSEEEKERLFYVSALEILDNIRNRLVDFSNNLNFYTQVESKTRFLYLAQAKENLLIAGKTIYSLQEKAGHSIFASPKFEQNLYNIQYAHQELTRTYLDELESVFTSEGVSDYQFYITKFSKDQNKNFKDLERELSSAIRFAEKKIEK